MCQRNIFINCTSWNSEALTVLPQLTLWTNITKVKLKELGNYYFFLGHKYLAGTISKTVKRGVAETGFHNKPGNLGSLCRIQRNCRWEHAIKATAIMRQTQYIPGRLGLFCQHSAGRSGSAADSGCRTGPAPQGAGRHFRERLRRYTRQVWRQIEHSEGEQLRWTTTQRNRILCSSASKMQ